MMAATAAIITARSLQVSYGSESDDLQAGLNGVTFSIPTGEFVAVIGRSGAGKTTLLRSLTGFVRPTGGHLVVAGTDVPSASGRELRNLRRNCAAIPQHFNLVERLTALDNVLMGRLGQIGTLRSLLNLIPQCEREFAYRLLCDLGLSDRAMQRVDRLSGGERQRVAIARALAQEPQIMLADEPAASLDISLTRLVLDTLQRLNREHGLTVIASLHNLRLAHEYASRIMALRHGKLVFDGVPAELDATIQREVYDSDESADIRPIEQPHLEQAAAAAY